MFVTRLSYLFCLLICLCSPLAVDAVPSLHRLENEVGLALEAGANNHPSFQELEQLNQYYFDRLLRALSGCKVSTPADGKTLQRIGDTLLLLYRYELSFPEFKKSIYPFRSTISHLSCMILEKAPMRVLEEKVEEFLSVYVVLKLSFETAQERLGGFLNDTFINSFKNALLSITRQNGFSPEVNPAQKPISLQGHEAILAQQPVPRSLGEGGGRTRRVLGGAAKFLLAALGIAGVAWLGKRYVVDPIRRYRNIADMAEKFLVRVKGLSVPEIIQEAVKATAGLPEAQQKQFFDVVFAAIKEKKLIDVAGNVDKKDVLKAMVETVGQLPQEQQEQMFRTVVQVFGIDCDDAVFEGMNVGQLKDDAQRFIVWYDRYKKACERAKGVKEKVGNFLGNVGNRVRNLVRREPAPQRQVVQLEEVVVIEEEEKEEIKEKVEENEPATTPLSEVIKKITKEINEEDHEDEEDDEYTGSDSESEDSDDEGYSTPQDEPEEEIEEQEPTFLQNWVVNPVRNYIVSPVKSLVWG